MNDYFTIIVSAVNPVTRKLNSYSVNLGTTEFRRGDELAWMGLRVLTHSMQNEMTEVRRVPTDRLLWEVIPRNREEGS